MGELAQIGMEAGKRESGAGEKGVVAAPIALHPMEPFPSG